MNFEVNIKIIFMFLTEDTNLKKVFVTVNDNDVMCYGNSVQEYFSYLCKDIPHRKRDKYVQILIDAFNKHKQENLSEEYVNDLVAKEEQLLKNFFDSKA